MNLPGLGGFEVCRRLKADPSLSAIYVVAVSGTRTAADRKVEGLAITRQPDMVQKFRRPMLKLFHERCSWGL